MTQGSEKKQTVTVWNSSWGLTSQNRPDIYINPVMFGVGFDAQSLVLAVCNGFSQGIDKR